MPLRLTIFTTPKKFGTKEGKAIKTCLFQENQWKQFIQYSNSWWRRKNKKMFKHVSIFVYACEKDPYTQYLWCWFCLTTFLLVSHAKSNSFSYSHLLFWLTVYCLSGKARQYLFTRLLWTQIDRRVLVVKPISHWRGFWELLINNLIFQHDRFCFRWYFYFRAIFIFKNFVIVKNTLFSLVTSVSIVRNKVAFNCLSLCSLHHHQPISVHCWT
jgi:hypothetical protein